MPSKQSNMHGANEGKITSSARLPYSQKKKSIQALKNFWRSANKYCVAALKVYKKNGGFPINAFRATMKTCE
jgi:hypothetical protein